MINISQHQRSWKRKGKVLHQIVDIVNLHHDTIDDCVIWLNIFNVSKAFSHKRKVHLNNTNNVLDSQEPTKKEADTLTSSSLSDDNTWKETTTT